MKNFIINNKNLNFCLILLIFDYYWFQEIKIGIFGDIHYNPDYNPKVDSSTRWIGNK